MGSDPIYSPMTSVLDPVVPFTIRVPGDSRVGKWGDVSTTKHRVHGLARLEGDALVLEWSGTIEHQYIGLEVRTERVPLPVRRLAIPVRLIRAIDLEGGWWRPRIELRVSALEALGELPGVEQDRARLKVSRRDRGAAGELVAAVEMALADRALAEAERRSLIGDR